MTDADFRTRMNRAVKNRSSLDGMRKAFQTIIDRQQENASRIPDLDARKERLRKTKESSVGNLQLLNQAIAVLRENGFRVAIVKTPEAAMKMMNEELKGQRLVVKSKSNVTKELHLSEKLEEAGIEVVETDLGDRIVQLAGCQPTHPTGPACHLTRREISDLFTAHFKKKVTDDPLELTRVMREEIADYMSKARVGITGANAIAANEGAIVIVHNEGNAAKCAMLPDKHIIVTTPEKIVPTLDDAINVTKLQTYLSTGKIISSYINVVTGPSYTADIEKKVFKGMHGPKEVLVIFVDDGRLDSRDKEPQFCIGCGMCLVRCPTYNVIGPVFGSSGHMGGIGVYLSDSLGKVDEALDGGMYTCTSCGSCVDACPAKIDTRKGIIAARENTRRSKKGILPEHTTVIASLRNYDNPWQVPRGQKAKWSEKLKLKDKGEVLYFAGCSTSLVFPETAKRAVRLIRAAGSDPAYLGPTERCCGSTVRKLGEERLARSKAEECFEDFRHAGAKLVVTSCPGCASALSHYHQLLEDSGTKVQHISQFLDERLDTSRLSGVMRDKTATYHDPCDLGRELGVFDPPRKLAEAALGRSLIEMDRARSSSSCCGSGSGVKSAYPELASAIGQDRVAMAEAKGADLMITSCPWCVQNLRECQGQVPVVEVLDLVDLIDRSIGEDPDN